VPIGEIEFHPYLNQGINDNSAKLILGSFPVYDCTDQDNAEKTMRRQLNGTFRFFYGSSFSNFWSTYSLYVDPQLIPPYSTANIANSLSNNGISITDFISSCDRIGKSSLDSHLRHRTYNIEQITELINLGIRKILCTSKGVLHALENRILLEHDVNLVTLNDAESNMLSGQLLAAIGGHPENVGNPICRVYDGPNPLQKLSVIAIPSPGSPYRRLKYFGHTNGNRFQFYQDYLTFAYTWFLA
jgi:hypothetical protein